MRGAAARAWCFAALSVAAIDELSAQVRVSESAWLSLAEPERSAISERHLVIIVPTDTAGVIVDAQTINESAPGTTAGAQLGAAYGSALYFDRSSSYSATRDVTIAIAGALIGSLADRGPSAQFRTRYTVRTLDGRITYHDELKADAFRHSVGVCVSLAGFQAIEQALCTETAGDLRRRYISPDL